jgi:hypothetical protein
MMSEASGETATRNRIVILLVMEIIFEDDVDLGGFPQCLDPRARDDGRSTDQHGSLCQARRFWRRLI